MRERKRVFLLFLILAVASTIVASVAVYLLYDVAFEEEKERLAETAQSQARLIEAVARFDAKYSKDYPAGSEAATLSQIIDAHRHYNYFSETGELTLARREGNHIVFLLSHRHYDVNNPKPVRFDSELAEPMRRALSGKSGTVVGLDYRGETVLAVHEPVAEMNLGIVAKIDLSEIRAPFVRAIITTGVVTILVVLGGTVLFHRVTNPIIRNLRERTARLTQEIKERKRAEEALRESEEKYRNLFEDANDSIFIIDPSTHRFLDVNQNAVWRLGYTREELLQLTIDDIDTPMTAVRNEDIIRELQESGSVIFEHAHRCKDGKEIPVEISSRVIEYADQQVFQSFVRDISERRKAEEERDRLLGELRNKNKELEQIVYVTSHDLRSPLVNIQGFSKELEQAFKHVHSALHSEEVSSAIRKKLIPILEEDIPAALQYIFTSTSKMGSLLSGLLRLSHLSVDAPTIKQLDMNRLISDVAGALEFQIKEAGVILKIDELPSCRGKETQINQVFSNLMDNALKYLDPNRAGIIRVSGRKETGRVVYCLEDNGIGIAVEHQNKIFELFHCLDPDARGGVGLGLAIVRKILDLHGGKIWVESELGKGSKFFASLPADNI